MANNSYFEVLEKIATSLKTVAEGMPKVLTGRRYDFSTDDGVRLAVRDIALTLGGEVSNE